MLTIENMSKTQKNVWSLQTAWNKPDKVIPPGTLVRFVHAAGRYKNEKPRSPGSTLLGEVAVVLGKEEVDYHGWGGIFHLCGQDGEVFRHHGDFLEIVE